MAPEHRLASRAYLRAEDFSSETLLSYSAWADSTVCQRLLVPAGVAPAQLLQVRLTEAIIELAKAGVGVGVLSKWAAAPHLKAGTVKAVPITRARFGRVWTAAFLKRTASSATITDFVDVLEATRPFGMPAVTDASPDPTRTRARRQVA